jgi:hypothetical protein
LLKRIVPSVTPWWCPTDAILIAPSVSTHKTHYRQIEHERNIEFQNLWKVLSKNFLILISCDRASWIMKVNK